MSHALSPFACAARYNSFVVTRGIREYLGRDWHAVRANKDAYWAERVARLGAYEALRVADELRCQMLSMQPAWPDVAQRDDDLRSHICLAERFRRAGPARGR
jgi:hypothetical protein